MKQVDKLRYFYRFRSLTIRLKENCWTADCERPILQYVKNDYIFSVNINHSYRIIFGKFISFFLTTASSNWTHIYQTISEFNKISSFPRKPEVWHILETEIDETLKDFLTNMLNNILKWNYIEENLVTYCAFNFLTITVYYQTIFREYIWKFFGSFMRKLKALFIKILTECPNLWRNLLEIGTTNHSQGNIRAQFKQTFSHMIGYNIAWLCKCSINVKQAYYFFVHSKQTTNKTVNRILFL